jgi:hypothetical protein
VLKSGAVWAHRDKLATLLGFPTLLIFYDFSNSNFIRNCWVARKDEPVATVSSLIGFPAHRRESTRAAPVLCSHPSLVTSGSSEILNLMLVNPPEMFLPEPSPHPPLAMFYLPGKEFEAAL